MKKIEVWLEDDVYEALIKEVIPLLSADDKISDGIAKWIKQKLGMDIKELNIDDFLNAVPDNFAGVNFRELCKDLVDELKKNDGITIALPSKDAWRKYKQKWITIKKKQPKGRRVNIGWIESRDKGFVVYVYNPEKRDYEKITVSILQVTESKPTNSIWEEIVFSVDKWNKLKKEILELFNRAYHSI